VEAGQSPEQDIADRSRIYRSYWSQWNFLVVRDGALVRHSKSADGGTKTAQTFLPRRKVNEVLAEVLEGPSGGHFGVNKTLQISDSGTICYTQGPTLRCDGNSVIPAQHAEAPEPGGVT
jgi:hypothetical protein